MVYNSTCIFHYIYIYIYIQVSDTYTIVYNSVYIYIYIYIFIFLPHALLYQLYYLLWAFVIPECTVNVDTLDLFFGSPDDDSIQSKHVAIRIFCIMNCCVWLKFIPCMRIWRTLVSCKLLRQHNDIGVRIIPQIQRFDLQTWLREYFSETSLRSCSTLHVVIIRKITKMNPHRTKKNPQILY